MNIKLLAGLVIALPLITVACSKKEAPAQEQATTEASTTTAPAQVTAEQQAAIDSIDQPNPEAIKVEGETPVEAATTESTPESQPTTEVVAEKAQP